MSWFNRGQSAVLGIDIGTAAIKLVELSWSGARYRVESYALIPFPQDLMVDKQIANIDIIANAIKLAVKQSGTKNRQACVAVAGSAVMSKVLSLPGSLIAEEMEEQILLEADEYIPYALDEVNLDFEVQQVSENNAERVDVLLAASRRENVDERIEVLDKAGLKVKIVDVEAFAMENAVSLLADQLPDTIDKPTIAIIDVGATMSTLNVIHECRTVYTREQAFGGKQLTEAIQCRYGLSYEDAAFAKKHGGLPANYFSDVLDPFKTALVQQMARSLQFFVSSSAYRSIDSIVLAGGCSSITGLEQLMKQNLGISTFVSNPFINMAISNKVKPQSLKHAAPAMMIACGLALRSFD